MGTAESFHDLPYSFSAYCVECFGQVDEGNVESFILLPAFFLQLSEDEHHVCSDPVSSEATLALWGVVFSDGGHQSVEQYPCENFSCDGEQSYPPVVVAV